MANTSAYVANGNGSSFGPAESAEVYTLTDEQYDEVIDAIMVDGDEQGLDSLDEFPSVSVTDLLRIAETAEAVLDSELGVKSLSELAAALERAGFGTWTTEYPTIEDRD